MKIQLDTTKKTIKVEGDVKIIDLMRMVKKLLPNNEWKQFTLETNTTITYWNSPTIIRQEDYRYVKPYYPSWGKYDVLCKTTGTSSAATTGYCVANNSSKSIINLEVREK